VTVQAHRLATQIPLPDEVPSRPVRIVQYFMSKDYADFSSGPD
jgi:hypothetical protein